MFGPHLWPVSESLSPAPGHLGTSSEYETPRPPAELVSFPYVLSGNDSHHTDEGRLSSPSPKPSMSESGLATTPSTLCSLWAYSGWLAGKGRGACRQWGGYPECHPPSSEPTHLPCPHGNVRSFLSPALTLMLVNRSLNPLRAQGRCPPGGLKTRVIAVHGPASVLAVAHGPDTSPPRACVSSTVK